METPESLLGFGPAQGFKAARRGSNALEATTKKLPLASVVARGNSARQGLRLYQAAATARRWRRMAAPVRPKPAIIIAQLAGSGTLVDSNAICAVDLA